MANKIKRLRAAMLGFASVLILAVFAASVISEESIKYTEMEKEILDEDSNQLLKEYYADILGTLGNNTKFNMLSKKENIAILNLTVDGKDRRMITKLNTGLLLPGNLTNTNTNYITAINLVALGNISYKGWLYKETEKNFGLRRLYGVGSSMPRYIDEGRSRLYNGKANITVNPVLRELIEGYAIFLSPEGVTKGLYVAEKTKSYFVVKGVNPSSNIAFSWMLRGTPVNFADENLKSYSKTANISIVAKINYGNQTTEISIYGLKNVSNNPIGNDGITDNNSINKSSSLITANVALEDDLSPILSDTPEELPLLEEQLPATNETEAEQNQTEWEIKPASQPKAANQTQIQPVPEKIVVRITLYSTDESKIIEYAASATGLSASDVRKFISFDYAAPEDFSDEVIEESKTNIDFVQKINGTVIVRLG